MTGVAAGPPALFVPAVCTYLFFLNALQHAGGGEVALGGGTDSRCPGAAANDVAARCQPGFGTPDVIAPTVLKRLLYHPSKSRKDIEAMLGNIDPLWKTAMEDTPPIYTFAREHCLSP